MVVLICELLQFMIGQPNKRQIKQKASTVAQINKQAPPLANMLSSLALSSSTSLDKQQTRKVNIILKALLEHNQSYDFKQPVDWKGMNLSDYLSVVKHPMDLSTVEKNWKNGKYHYVQQFLDHVQLIWDNCKLYNMANSWIYEVAEKIERNFKKMVRNYFPDITIVIPLKIVNPTKNEKKSAFQNMSMYADEDITYFEKLKFCEKVEKLEEDQLEKLVKWIQENCPDVLKDVNEDRVQILVDNFTQQLFHEASEIIYKFADGMVDRVSKRVKLT